MSTVGQRERATQERVVKLFQEHLNYTYLGNWIDRNNNRNIEQGLLSQWLERQGIGQVLINKALRELDRAAALGEGINLYDANQAVYGLLRYGVKVREGAGQQSQAVWMINWRKPEKNDFAIAEEVTVSGENKKRPDIACNIATKRIWINLELAKKPPECLAYILVHEMVHLLERLHNDRFKTLMDRFMPQWRLYREALNRTPLAHEEWYY